MTDPIDLMYTEAFAPMIRMYAKAFAPMIELTDEEMWDLHSALERAQDDLSYAMSFEGNYEPEDIPELEALLARWSALQDKLIAILHRGA